MIRLTNQKKKIIIVVSIPSACAGIAYVLTDKMVKKGYQFVPMITTDKVKKEFSGPEVCYMDEEEFQINLSKGEFSVYGTNQGVFWGITKEIIKGCVENTEADFFLRLNLDEAIQLKKEDASSFAIVCVDEYQDLQVPSLLDIDMYIPGKNTTEIDIDRILDLITKVGQNMR